MAELTITEALAETKTIDKRVASKREFVLARLARHEQIKDPHADIGGSAKVIEQELQAIHDLEERKVQIRRAIQAANVATEVTVLGITRTIADWLVWRREVASSLGTFYQELASAIHLIREDSRRKGAAVVSTADIATRGTDIIINLDEMQLARNREKLEETLGQLDGLLSLKNATVFITIE